MAAWTAVVVVNVDAYIAPILSFAALANSLKQGSKAQDRCGDVGANIDIYHTNSRCMSAPYRHADVNTRVLNGCVTAAVAA